MDFRRISGRWTRAIAIGGLAAIAGLLALWHFHARAPYVPTHPLRIGFENNPPVQIRTASGFSGLSVEIVSAGARRAGIELEWVETGTSSEEAFRKGLVDLWPMMVDMPHRRKFVHFPPPYLHSNNVLLLLEGTPTPGRDYRGPIAVFRLPLLVRQLRGQFPEAQIMEIPEFHDVLKAVCGGKAAAGFFEARAAQGELRDRHPDCASAQLRLQTIPELRFHAGLASTFEAAAAADRIQREIGNMFRDGTLAVLIAKYSYFGLDDTWASYEQVEAEKRLQWMTWAGSGIVCALGVTLWLAGSLRERKRVEAAIRESEERFRSLADTAPVLSWVSGPDKLLTFINRGWLTFTGSTMEQAVGNGWIEKVHPDDRDRCYTDYSSAFDAHRTFQTECRLRRADGEYRWMLIIGSPRFEASGAFAGFIGSCTDITDLKRSQEESLARQKLESLGVLAGGVAHDFNNLLGSVIANSELVLSELPDGSPAADGVESIKTVAGRAAEIVRQMMSYAGQGDTVFEPVDLSELLHEMVEFLKVSVSKRATLSITIPQELPAVRANAAQLRQVLLNLITNASEGLGEQEGVISITAARLRLEGSDGAPDLCPGDYIRLEVSDNGSGMTEEVQSKIFDPFFSTKFAGRGMGLAVVKGVVHSHDGAINVVSGPGQGSRFEILLPCSNEPSRKGHDQAGFSAAGKVVTSSGAVLIVEDEHTLRNAVSKMLRRKGFTVFEAADGEAGASLFRDKAPEIDVVLLDLTLPGLSGEEVLRELRRLQPDVTVIVTSAYSREQAQTTLGAQSPWLYIRKPYQVHELTDLLRESIRVKRRVRDLAIGREPPEWRATT